MKPNDVRNSPRCKDILSLVEDSCIRLPHAIPMDPIEQASEK